MFVKTSLHCSNFLAVVKVARPKLQCKIDCGHWHLQVAQIRLQLQTAVDDSHPAPPAVYLRQAAAACLKYGLKSGLSGLQLEGIKLFQAIGYIVSACPDVQGITQKLQNSKYFSIVKQTNQPHILHMNLHALIVPHQRVAVASLLDTIKCQQTPGSQEVRLLPSGSKQTSSADSLPKVMQPHANAQVGGCLTNCVHYMALTSACQDHLLASPAFASACPVPTKHLIHSRYQLPAF